MVSLGEGLSSSEELSSESQREVPAGAFNLLTMLTDVGTHHVIKEFMEEHNDEGHLVLLWLELQEYRSIPSPSFRVAAARKIVQKYVVRHGNIKKDDAKWARESSPTNVPSGVKKRPSLDNMMLNEDGSKFQLCDELVEEVMEAMKEGGTAVDAAFEKVQMAVFSQMEKIFDVKFTFSKAFQSYKSNLVKERQQELRKRKGLHTRIRASFSLRRRSSKIKSIKSVVFSDPALEGSFCASGDCRPQSERIPSRRISTSSATQAVEKLHTSIENYRNVPSVSGDNDDPVKGRKKKAVNPLKMSPNELLVYILNSPKFCRYFKEFLQQERSIGILLFFYDVESFRLLPDGNHLRHQARKLRVKYLQPNSSCRIDLPGQMRAEVEMKLSVCTTVSPDLFNEIQAHVVQNLRTFFPAFRACELGISYFRGLAQLDDDVLTGVGTRRSSRRHSMGNAPQLESTPLTLLDVLQDFSGYMQFKAFLSESSPVHVNSLLFWREAEDFNHLPDQTYANRQVHKIWRKYLAPTAKMPVLEVDSTTKSEIEACVDNPTPDMFNKAQEIAFFSMQDFYLGIFQSSTLYREYLRNAECGQPDGNHSGKSASLKYNSKNTSMPSRRATFSAPKNDLDNFFELSPGNDETYPSGTASQGAARNPKPQTGSSNSPKKRSTTLSNIFCDRVLSHFFKEYLEQQDHGRPASLLMFWQEVEDFKCIPAVNEPKKRAHEIFGKYLSPEASSKVELPADLVMDVEASLFHGITRGMFNQIQDSLYNHIKMIIFPCFLAGPKYVELQQAIEKRGRGLVNPRQGRDRPSSSEGRLELRLSGSGSSPAHSPTVRASWNIEQGVTRRKQSYSEKKRRSSLDSKLREASPSGTPPPGDSKGRRSRRNSFNKNGNLQESTLAAAITYATEAYQQTLKGEKSPSESPSISDRKIPRRKSRLSIDTKDSPRTPRARSGEPSPNMANRDLGSEGCSSQNSNSRRPSISLERRPSIGLEQQGGVGLELSCESVLHDTLGLEYLKKFVKENFGSFHLQFWLEIDDFKRLPELWYIESRARKLYRKFLSSESRMKTKMEKHILNDIEEILNERNPDKFPKMFDEAQGIAFERMSKEYLPSFLESSNFEAAYEAKEKGRW